MKEGARTEQTHMLSLHSVVLGKVQLDWRSFMLTVVPRHALALGAVGQSWKPGFRMLIYLFIFLDLFPHNRSRKPQSFH